ncbi:hypothetical protein FRX31_006669, partial [Thalictrum thalictroides]
HIKRLRKILPFLFSSDSAVPSLAIFQILYALSAFINKFGKNVRQFLIRRTFCVAFRDRFYHNASVRATSNLGLVHQQLKVLYMGELDDTPALLMVPSEEGNSRSVMDSRFFYQKKILIIGGGEVKFCGLNLCDQEAISDDKLLRKRNFGDVGRRK